MIRQVSPLSLTNRTLIEAELHRDSLQLKGPDYKGMKWQSNGISLHFPLLPVSIGRLCRTEPRECAGRAHCGGEGGGGTTVPWSGPAGERSVVVARTDWLPSTITSYGPLAPGLAGSGWETTRSAKSVSPNTAILTGDCRHKITHKRQAIDTINLL